MMPAHHCSITVLHIHAGTHTHTHPHVYGNTASLNELATDFAT